MKLFQGFGDRRHILHVGRMLQIVVVKGQNVVDYII